MPGWTAKAAEIGPGAFARFTAFDEQNAAFSQSLP
jgi:hypothetical protein